MNSAPGIIAWAVETYGPDLAISTSFQREGMVIVDMAAKIDPRIRVITLDTGRLPEETYRMIELVRERYGIAVETVSPNATELESMIAQHGPNLFRQNVASRMLCCQIRKVRPLERKLREFKAYMVGLRRGQSESRASVETVDTTGLAAKISPLADWTAGQVLEYTERHRVPVHPLYAKGYASIGCEPCTRAIEAGEAERAGRWWWELEADKECGLHFSPDGRAERQVDVLLREVLASHA
ncbi:MAG: phosphoadenylyl-sulfate reductase [Acidobacteriota bacterium]|nr:phosphoadenylyl-sulfate reductase [Acidobacteriota bacterium]